MEAGPILLWRMLGWVTVGFQCGLFRTGSSGSRGRIGFRSPGQQSQAIGFAAGGLGQAGEDGHPLGYHVAGQTLSQPGPEGVQVQLGFSGGYQESPEKLAAGAILHP